MPLREFAARVGPLDVVGEGALSLEELAGAGTAAAAAAAAASGPSAPASTRELRAACMQDTTLASLALRVGKTYVYTHQGSCEHALRVRDVRRACAADARGRDAYPLLTYATERPRKRCAICDSLLATKVVYGSRLAPESPCFFCDECFQVRRRAACVRACMHACAHLLICACVCWHLFPCGAAAALQRAGAAAVRGF